MQKRIVALALLGCVALLAMTPAGCYLSRGAVEEAKILSNRRPIARLVRDPSVDEGTRSKLKVVLDAREFAKVSLGLKTKESFTSYSKLDADTLVLVLSAAYRDSLKAYTWWFPIVGRVPYKGYFDFERAKRDEQKLQRDGFDTYLRPSDAFSTLGWFNDPVLSTSLRRDSTELANTVIHELTHNTFYAPGQAYFNESFASFVGARGAAAFFQGRGQERAAREVEARWADEKLLSVFWAQLLTSLDSAFSAHSGSRTERLGARDTVYARARAALITDVSRKFQTIGPTYATRVPLDNAALLARRIYAQDLQCFDDVYVREGKSLNRAIARIIGLARANPKDPYGALHRFLGK
ncbi:MAG: aminopeptidase [Gemmatimonadaceae bacterium]|nr:aminopeptidase [Gemmatimonadaceae bacterium]